MHSQKRVSTALLLAALLIAAVPVLAQGPSTRGAVGVGSGDHSCNEDPLNPCGSLPWSIPVFPPIYSPTPYTPIPTRTPVEITPTPSATHTPTTTPTASPTFVEHSGDHDQLATLSAQTGDTQATLAAMQDQQIGGMAAATAAAAVGGYAETFAGYMRGLQLLNVRGTGGAMGALLLFLVFVVLVWFATGVIPVIAMFARWIARVAEIVAEFIPF